MSFLLARKILRSLAVIDSSEQRGHIRATGGRPPINVHHANSLCLESLREEL